MTFAGNFSEYVLQKNIEQPEAGHRRVRPGACGAELGRFGREPLQRASLRPLYQIFLFYEKGLSSVSSNKKKPSAFRR